MRGKYILGFFLIFLGVILLGNSLDLFDVSFDDFFSHLFPFILIGFGVWMILRRRKKEQDININIHAEKFEKVHDDLNNFSEKMDDFSQKVEDTFRQSSYTSPDPNKYAQNQSDSKHSSHSQNEQESHSYSKQNGKIKYNKALGDMFVDCAGINMQNVEVSMGIGEVEMKLHNGVFEDGLNRLIISCFIGDIRIYVPQSLEVFANCSNFIGDIEAVGERTSGFGNSVESQTLNYDKADKKLYIAANNFIGDIKIHII